MVTIQNIVNAAANAASRAVTTAKRVAANVVAKVSSETWQHDASRHWKVITYTNGRFTQTAFGDHNSSGTPVHVASENKKYATCSICGRRMNCIWNGNSGGSGGSGGGGGGGGEGGGGGGGGGGSNMPASTYTGTNEFPITPQAFYIYNKSNNETYMMDGVLKVAHTMTLKLEEEPSKEGADYVNNALNEPNKVTFDVIMSDVYTDRNALTNKDKTRSVSALIVLNEIKRSRVLVDVITNLMTYKDMLLAGLSLSQDADTTHFGWYGQLTFQEKPEGGGGGGGGEERSTEVTKHTGKSSGCTPSVWVNWVGANFI